MMATRNPLLQLGALCLFLHLPLRAEVASLRIGSVPKGPPAAPKVSKASAVTAYVVQTAEPPRLDGKLDEEIWKKAVPLSLGFTLDGSGRASQATEVRLLRDDQNLYVGYRCSEPFPKKIKATARDHDGSIWEDDSVEFFLGPQGAAHYFHFGVNAAGSTYDGQEKTVEWNSGIKAATGTDEANWYAEISIPFEKMVGKKGPRSAWIANFNRNRYAGGAMEEFAWSPVGSDNSHSPSRFGALLFENPPPPEKDEKPAPQAVRREAVSILPVAQGAGEGVVQFDLSPLPKEAKLYRAELRVFRSTEIDGRHDAARVPIEIYPLVQPFQEGGTVQAQGDPLPLVAPWYDRFDATAAVQKWLSGSPRGGFLVKAFPLWNREAVALDLLFEGASKNPPPPVTGLKAVHRSGQTFLTWKEIEDRAGRDELTWGAMKRMIEELDTQREVRYHVLRSAQPIDAAHLHEARRIAEVRPLSGWNVNGRSLDRAINEFIAETEVLNHHQWNPFSGASVDGKYGLNGRLDRLVIQEGQAPLPRDAGLFVHNASEAGKFYYAVLTSIDGVLNTRDLSAENSLTEPLVESPAEGEPVLQRELPAFPYFNYREKRLHYVHWSSPAHGNLPNQYHNWMVAVPEPLGKEIPLELSLHRAGRSYWTTQYRIEQDSLLVAPYDFPRMSYWYGYHEALDTLRSFGQGSVHPYTERRVLWFVDWAAKKWPVDRNRIFVTSTVSQLGALHLAVRNPQVFSMMLGGGAQPDYGRPSQETMHALWGPPDWKMKTAEGASVWDELNLTKRVSELPGKTELPVVTYTGAGLYPYQRDFFAALLEKGHLTLATFGVYGGGRVLPIALNGNWGGMIPLDIRKNRSHPAFKGIETKSLYEKPKEASGNLVVSDGSLRYWGEFNLGYRWRTDNLVDEAERYEIELSWDGRNRLTEAPADVTLRNLQAFKAEKGKKYRWTFNALQDEKALIQEGTLSVGEDELLVIPGLKISSRGGRLAITPAKE